MICVGEILELESEDLGLIPDSCHIAAMRIWASHFPSRNFGFFICKWVYSATQLTLENYSIAWESYRNGRHNYYSTQ